MATVTVVSEPESNEQSDNNTQSQPTQDQANQAIEFGRLLERNRQNEVMLSQLQSRLEVTENQARISAEQSQNLQAKLDQLLQELETEELENDEVTLVIPEPEPQLQPQITTLPKRQQSRLAQFLFGVDE